MKRRQIAGHHQTVGAAMIEERAQLLPLAEQGFELLELSSLEQEIADDSA